MLRLGYVHSRTRALGQVVHFQYISLQRDGLSRRACPRTWPFFFENAALGLAGDILCALVCRNPTNPFLILPLIAPVVAS